VDQTTSWMRKSDNRKAHTSLTNVNIGRDKGCPARAESILKEVENERV
jgi:hypothetical protein